MDRVRAMNQPGAGPGLKNFRFLVIDHHAQLRLMVRNVLHALGARDILEAPNGRDGLVLARESQPDIITTDWTMEPMDGIEMVKNIRQSNDDQLKYVPVIMLTAFSERERIMTARDCGINEYLLKPISAKMLYGRIRAVIEQPRRFVETSRYFGPDRRRGAQDFPGTDRRGGDGTAMPEHLKEHMTQSQIEDEYFMPTESGSAASADQYTPSGILKAREMAKKNRR